MRNVLKGGVALAALLMSAGSALAECGIEEGSVRILSNDFEALRIIGDEIKECESANVDVTINQTIEHKNIQVPALTTNPATYSAAMIATNSIVPLLNADLVRPLDEYVEKWGQDLQEHQLIRVDGKIMAVAFMANGQHFYYREDILAENGIEPPKTFEDVLAAAETLRENGVMEAPFASNYKPGWDLGAEFVNAYLGTGGSFFAPGSAELTIENENGIAALEAMKALSGYMRSDFITSDANTVAPLWKDGELAMMFAWGSRGREFLDETESETAAYTALSAMPTIGDGSVPAAALWWDGFVIAKNVSDVDAEASFRALVHGISPEVAEEHRDSAVWLISGYEPTPSAAGVAANIEGGARSYPMEPYMGLLHTAASDNLSEFLLGEESAEQALADVTAAYTTAAQEGGFLN